MASAKRVFRNLYRDSVSLMQLSAKLGALAGVRQASAIMATPGNLDLLREAGLAEGEVAAGPNDLLVALEGEDEDALEAALAATEAELTAAACAASGRPAPHAAAQPRDGAAGSRERQPRPDLDARRLCRRRGDEGAAARPQRDAVQRQRLARATRSRSSATRARTISWSWGRTAARRSSAACRSALPTWCGAARSARSRRPAPACSRSPA